MDEFRNLFKSIHCNIINDWGRIDEADDESGNDDIDKMDIDEIVKLNPKDYDRGETNGAIKMHK